MWQLRSREEEPGCPSFSNPAYPLPVRICHGKCFSQQRRENPGFPQGCPPGLPANTSGAAGFHWESFHCSQTHFSWETGGPLFHEKSAHPSDSSLRDYKECLGHSRQHTVRSQGCSSSRVNSRFLTGIPFTPHALQAGDGVSTNGTRAARRCPLEGFWCGCDSGGITSERDPRGSSEGGAPRVGCGGWEVVGSSCSSGRMCGRFPARIPLCSILRALCSFPGTRGNNPGGFLQIKSLRCVCRLHGLGFFNRGKNC